MKAIQKKIFIFINDFNNFSSKNNINEIKVLNENVEKLNKFNLDYNIQYFANLSEQILEQLKILQCNEELLFEKADLIISIFSIKEQLEELLKRSL
jgi:hypothetical protein